MLYTKIRSLFVLLRIPENMSPAGGGKERRRKITAGIRLRPPLQVWGILREVSGCARTRVQTILGFRKENKFMDRLKRRLAYLLATMLLFALVAPAAPEVTAFAATKNSITELGIEKLPEGNAIQVGDVFNFNPDIIATELGKGKTTGKVWWEINTKTNTAGVSSSRWGYVYPLYEGSFEIRALAFV